MQVADPVAEAMVNTVITADVIISLHTANPGLTGAAEATGVNRSTIAALDGWNAYATVSGARVVTNALLEEFSDSATVSEDLGWFMLWEMDGTTPILSNAITNPQTTTVGNPVRFPIGSFTFGMETTF